jgi:zinc protease
MNLTAWCQERVTVFSAGAAVLAVTLVFSPGGAMAKDVFPFAVTTRTLDNGLSVVMVPFDSPGIATYYTIVRAGSRNEPEPGKSGFAHFFEHMMFRGTDRYSSEAFNAVYRKLGSDPNAYTSDDVTVYTTLVPKDGLEKTIDVESDRFMNLKYSESDFKQESKAVLGEYNKNNSDPENRLYEKVRATAYTTHTYRHTTMGFIEDIQNMPNQFEYSREFFHRYYTPGNCVVLIVGDFDIEATYKLIQKYYGPWKSPNNPAPVPAEPEQTAARSAKISWDNATLPYGLAVGGPARVGHACGTQPGAVVHQALELRDLALGLLHEQRVIFEDGHARGVVPAVLEALQALDQDGHRLRSADVADDSAHG